MRRVGVSNAALHGTVRDESVVNLVTAAVLLLAYAAYLIFLLKTLIILLFMAMLQSMLTRLRIDQTVGMWWRFGALLALLQILVIVLLKGWLV